MLEKRNYVNNLLKSEKFNKLFCESNRVSLRYIDTENIRNYLNLFSGKTVDENFINIEIKNNYLDGNYSLLLELYEYAIKYDFVNEINAIFALFATIKLNLFLIFTLRMQIYFQKMKRFYCVKNRTNRVQKQFLIETILDKKLLEVLEQNKNLKQEEKDKSIVFFQEKIKIALNEEKFKDALHIYDSAYFSNHLNFDINNYGAKATKKVDNINIREDIKSSLNRINYKIIFNEDKQLINKAIKISTGLRNYNIISQYENHLDKIIQQNSIKMQKTINNTVVSLKTRRIQRGL